MYYGIDLGTSTCLVGNFTKEKNIELIKYEDGKDYFSSIIKFNKVDEVIIGKDVLDKNYDSIGGYVDLIKSKIGNVNALKLLLQGEEKVVSLQYCTALLLNYINLQEKFVKEKNKVIITVPANFEQSKRNATIEACKQAGLENIELIEEPSAAVMYHLYKHYATAEKIATLINPKNILVFDFGGGTLDLSLINVELDSKNHVVPKVIKVLGDNCLGGALIDIEFALAIVNYKKEEDQSLNSLYRALESYKKNYENNRNRLFDNEIEEKDRALVLALIKKVEKAKKEIIKNGSSYFEFNNIKIEITMDDFNQIVFKEGHIEKKIKRLINFFRIDNLNKIDEIILVGGSSKIPIVKEILLNEFNGIDIIMKDDYINAIVYGATIVAAIKNGEKVNPFDLNSCSGILSKNIYLKTNKIVKKILEYGVPYPLKENKKIEYEIEFSLNKSIEIEVLEGLDQGKELDLIAKVNFYHPCFYTGDKLELEINIDESGLLSFSAVHKSTGEKIEFESKRNFSLDKKKIEAGNKFIKTVKYLR